jgi:hypothetical protein
MAAFYLQMCGEVAVRGGVPRNASDRAGHGFCPDALCGASLVQVVAPRSIDHSHAHVRVLQRLPDKRVGQVRGAALGLARKAAVCIAVIGYFACQFCTEG